MEVLAPKMIASAVVPSGPKVLVVAAVAAAVAVAVPAVAVATAGVAVVAVATVPAGVVALVAVAAVAAVVVVVVAVVFGVVVAPGSPKTCWRRCYCRQGPGLSRGPRHLASAHHRELVAPLLLRTDPSAAFSVVSEEGSTAVGCEPDCRLGPEMEVPEDLAWPRMSRAWEFPGELCR